MTSSPSRPAQHRSRFSFGTKQAYNPSPPPPPSTASSSDAHITHARSESRSLFGALAPPSPSFFSRSRSSSNASSSAASQKSTSIDQSPKSSSDRPYGANGLASSTSHVSVFEPNDAGTARGAAHDLHRTSSPSRTRNGTPNEPGPPVRQQQLASSTGSSRSPSSSLVLKGRKSFDRLRRLSFSTSQNLQHAQRPDDDEEESLAPTATSPITTAMPSRAASSSAFPFSSSSTPTRPSIPTRQMSQPILSIPLAPEAPPSSPSSSRVAGAGRELKRKGSKLFTRIKNSSTSLATFDSPVSLAPLPVKGPSTQPSSDWKGGSDMARPRERTKETEKKDAAEKESLSDFVLVRDSMYQVKDDGIGMPYNVQHELHVESDDLACLPPEWVAQLRAQGLSSTELLRLAKSKSQSALSRAATFNIPIRHTPPPSTPSFNSHSQPHSHSHSHTKSIPRKPPPSSFEPFQTHHQTSSASSSSTLSRSSPPPLPTARSSSSLSLEQQRSSPPFLPPSVTASTSQTPAISRPTIPFRQMPSYRIETETHVELDEEAVARERKEQMRKSRLSLSLDGGGEAEGWADGLLSALGGRGRKSRSPSPCSTGIPDGPIRQRNHTASPRLTPSSSNPALYSSTSSSDVRRTPSPSPSSLPPIDTTPRSKPYTSAVSPYSSHPSSLSPSSALSSATKALPDLPTSQSPQSSSHNRLRTSPAALSSVYTSTPPPTNPHPRSASNISLSSTFSSSAESRRRPSPKFQSPSTFLAYTNSHPSPYASSPPQPPPPSRSASSIFGGSSSSLSLLAQNAPTPSPYASSPPQPPPIRSASSTFGGSGSSLSLLHQTSPPLPQSHYGSSPPQPPPPPRAGKPMLYNAPAMPESGEIARGGSSFPFSSSFGEIGKMVGGRGGDEPSSSFTMEAKETAQVEADSKGAGVRSEDAEEEEAGGEEEIPDAGTAMDVEEFGGPSRRPSATSAYSHQSSQSSLGSALSIQRPSSHQQPTESDSQPPSSPVVVASPLLLEKEPSSGPDDEDDLPLSALPSLQRNPSVLSSSLSTSNDSRFSTSSYHTTANGTTGTSSRVTSLTPSVMSSMDSHLFEEAVISRATYVPAPAASPGGAGGARATAVSRSISRHGRPGDLLIRSLSSPDVSALPALPRQDEEEEERSSYPSPRSDPRGRNLILSPSALPSPLPSPSLPYSHSHSYSHSQSHSRSPSTSTSAAFPSSPSSSSLEHEESPLSEARFALSDAVRRFNSTDTFSDLSGSPGSGSHGRDGSAGGGGGGGGSGSRFERAQLEGWPESQPGTPFESEFGVRVVRDDGGSGGERADRHEDGDGVGFGGTMGIGGQT